MRPTATVTTRYPTTIAQSTRAKFTRRLCRAVRQVIPGAGEGAVATGRGRDNVLGEMSASAPSPGSFVRRTVSALAVFVSAVAAVNVSDSSAVPQPSLPLPNTPATPAPAGPPGALFG